MINQQLFRVEDKIEKYLKKENLNDIVAIDSCNTETNLFNSIILSFKNSEEKLVFFDGEDGFIEIFKFNFANNSSHIHCSFLSIT